MDWLAVAAGVLFGGIANILFWRSGFCYGRAAGLKEARLQWDRERKRIYYLRGEYPPAHAERSE